MRAKIDGLTNLREIFNGMDLNDDKYIDKTEFKKSLNQRLKDVFSSKFDKSKQQFFFER